MAGLGVAGRKAFVLLAVLVVAWIARPTAHEIPVDVSVHAFLKPEGRQLRVLIRVPLRALRDVEFPTRGPGFLDLARIDPILRHAALQWVPDTLTAYEEGTPLRDVAVRATRVSLPSDRSFESWETALAQITGPALPAATDLFWDQGMLDVLLEYAIDSEQSNFSVRPAFARLGLRVTTVLRFVTPEGGIRAFEFTGDPGTVRLDPRWYQAARTFVALGFRHILDGPDHLLFLLCLVLPCRRLRPLVLVVTSFTAAHSVTLIGSAFNLAPDTQWFVPLIEALIATSIVYMAVENALLALQATDARDAAGAARRERGRYAIAFAFGLVHGFGFSFALRETMQFAGSHLLMSLLSFNVGVELGQILVVLTLVLALRLGFRYLVSERPGTIVVSAFVAHTGWHWTLDRWGQLRQFDWPTLDSTTLLTAVRWLFVVVAAAAAWWAAGRLRQIRQPQPSPMEEATPPQP